MRLTLERDVQELSRVRQARTLPIVLERVAGQSAQVLNAAELGHPVENFVVGETLKEVSWTDEIAGFGHWRTRDGIEVDLVLETDDGGVIAFEIKSASRATSDDFKGLRQLRHLLGDAFIAGTVFYTGSRSYTYDDRLHVLPIDRLWLEPSKPAEGP